ncbi:MAG: hypothetical protein HY554_10000 [Elusimicrobia bacterium]|nr:hypothetical protein [Elusimicrobiota bacterium]
MRLERSLAAISCALVFAGGPIRAEPLKVVGGYLDFNYYYDTRDLNVLTINSDLRMTSRLEYFSFVNYMNTARTSRNQDLAAYYTEQNLRWALPSELPFDLGAQFASADGGKNDVLRAGARWRASSTPALSPFLKGLGVFFATTIFPVQFDHRDGYHWQIEHVYRVDLFPEAWGRRAYLSGYADHNLGPGRVPWVAEHQLGIRVAGSLHAVVEYRYNGFLRDKNGVGLGLEYLASF